MSISKETPKSILRKVSQFDSNSADTIDKILGKPVKLIRFSLDVISPRTKIKNGVNTVGKTKKKSETEEKPINKKYSDGDASRTKFKEKLKWSADKVNKEVVQMVHEIKSCTEIDSNKPNEQSKVTFEKIESDEKSGKVAMKKTSGESQQEIAVKEKSSKKRRRRKRRGRRCKSNTEG